MDPELLKTLLAKLQFGVTSDPYERLPQPGLSAGLSVPFAGGDLGVSGHYQTFPYAAPDKWDVRLGYKRNF